MIRNLKIVIDNEYQKNLISLAKVNLILRSTEIEYLSMAIIYCNLSNRHRDRSVLFNSRSVDTPEILSFKSIRPVLKW